MTGPERIAHLRRLAHDLTPLRVGATLVQLLPTATLEISGERSRRIVGSVSTADLRPCQARRMVASALERIDVAGLAASLGLDPRRATYHLAVTVPVHDRGGGVYEVVRGRARQLLFATVLTPDGLVGAVAGIDPAAGSNLVCRQDPATGVTVAGLEHEDEAGRQSHRDRIARAAAACYASELIAGLADEGG